MVGLISLLTCNNSIILIIISAQSLLQCEGELLQTTREAGIEIESGIVMKTMILSREKDGQVMTEKGEIVVIVNVTVAILIVTDMMKGRGKGASQNLQRNESA